LHLSLLASLSHVLKRGVCMCCLNPYCHADGVSQAIDVLHSVREASPAAIWTLGRAFSSARPESAVTPRRQKSQHGREDQRPGQGGRPHPYSYPRYAIPDNSKGYAAVLVQETRTLLTTSEALTQSEMLLTEMLFELRNNKGAEPSPDVCLLCTLKLPFWAMWSASCSSQS